MGNNVTWSYWRNKSVCVIVQLNIFKAIFIYWKITLMEQYKASGLDKFLFLDPTPGHAIVVGIGLFFGLEDPT